MTTLMNALVSVPTVAHKITNKMIISNATIEEFSKDDRELAFCKGKDVQTGLRVSVLVNDYSFMKTEYAALINYSKTDKGAKADEAVKLSKKDFEQLVNAQVTAADEDII